MFKTHRRLLIELGKDALIVLLIVSALLLGRQTGILRGREGGSILPNHETPAENGSVTEAAVPFYIAVVQESGGRYGVTHNETEITEMYGRFSAVLGEALGSSGQPEQVDEEQWSTALSGPGVFFDYLYPQSLSVLSGWLGTEITGNAAAHSARRICLAPENDGLVLYYCRGGSEEFYRCATALSAATLFARIEEYMPNGAAFAGELTNDNAIDRYVLLESGIQKFDAVSNTNPLRDTALARHLPELFLFSGSMRSYTEADGIVYVEGDATLRVLTSGAVIYRCQDGGVELGGASASAQVIVEAARKLCQSGPGAVCGAARLGLSELRYEPAENTYTVCFEYAVNGVPVRLTDGAAVEMKIRNGLLCEAVMHYRSYTLEPETLSPLPAQTLALAAVKSVGGGEPLLAYVDTRKSVSLQWVAA